MAYSPGGPPSQSLPPQQPLGNAPLVSILITNYNYAHFLARSVESVVAQTFSQLELMIVDDGSTDSSLDLIRRTTELYRDRFYDCRYLRRDRNGGKVASLNDAIPLLRGDLTVILDADDVLSPQYVEITLGQLQEASERDPRVAFVYTDCDLVDSKDRLIGHGRSTDFDVELLRTESYIPECAITLTDVLKAVFPLDETIRVGTKHCKWLRVVASGRSGWYLPQPLFSYRMHRRNLSGIGRRIMQEAQCGTCQEKILSGYWSTHRAIGKPETRGGGDALAMSIDAE